MNVAIQVFLNDIVLLDLEHYVATTVNAVESQMPTPVSNCSITAVGNKCFVFGGTDLKGACYNDIRALDVGYYLSSTDITVGEGASSEYSFKILIIGDAGEFRLFSYQTIPKSCYLFLIF